MNFDRFLQKACPLFNLEWRKFRRRSARHRIERRMKELGFDDYGSYLGHLMTDRQEAEGFADLMRVTVSRFFRNRACWFEIVEKVLPGLIAGKASESVFRVWSVGCCGGEEPYTMAMIWLQYLQPRFPDRTIDIFATDIDFPSLERARMGQYDYASLREVPPEIIAAWFRLKNGRWLVDKRTRNLVRFQNHNLMEDPPPTGTDLVICRNLPFTYYRGDRLLAAALRLFEALRPEGALMIGKSETIDLPVKHLFEPWPGVVGVFRKRNNVTSSPNSSPIIYLD
ncbi:MAG TPA: protein-glutamate O-methyltransferase CheR [Geobacteraceae bacterium]|nr:protein-glutamate O-methyltransferase CheR [Geobacteraceae bacterium]